VIPTAIEAVLKGAERAFLAIANGLLFAMLAINLANILSRLAFDIGLIWVFPWTEVLFVWAIFFAFYVIYRRGQDVTIDVLTRRFPFRLRMAAEIFVALAVLTLMGLVLAQAPVLLPRQVGRIDLVGIQRYWLIMPFFASCILIALDFLMRLRVAVLALLKGQPA
jgi:TRAP-type C4-dicarboxylate transport system permease small subunit